MPKDVEFLRIKSGTWTVFWGVGKGQSGFCEDLPGWEFSLIDLKLNGGKDWVAFARPQHENYQLSAVGATRQEAAALVGDLVSPHILSGTCKRTGCYMFSEDSPDLRAVCTRRCRISPYLKK